MNTTAVHERLSAALAFPMASVLSRYQKETGTSNELASIHERELKRYLYICSQHPGAGWPMVTTIDELWHTFIIFTKEYHEFCRSLGVRYLHHQPFADGEAIDLAELDQRYQQFLLIYRREFGEPPSEVWPARLAAECGGGDCESNCVQCR